MAYAVYDNTAEMGARVEGFRPVERVGVVLGAAALGAVTGFVATIALGSLEPWMAAACAAPVYLAALYFASEGCREALRRREWLAALIVSLLLIGLAVWPITIFYAVPNAPAFWVGPASSFAMLAAFVLLSAGSAPRVYRASALGALIALLAVNQSLLTAMGA